MKLKNTGLQLARQVECAKQAGIYDAMFLAFGALLGYVRHGDMIPGDDDLDVGFMAEMITAEQETEYIRLMGESCENFPTDKGLFQYRRQVSYRDDTGRLFWISIRGKPQEECFKCCHWFFWTSRGYTWHCKGRGALVKGAPAPFLEIGPEIQFMGTTIHIPKMTGAVLDFWYQDWWTQRMGGNSTKKVLYKVDDWATMAGNVVEARSGC